MALTVSNVNHSLLGNLRVYIAQVTGDGTSTTLKVPFSRVVGAFTANINQSSAVAGISASGNTLTYGSAPESGKSHYLMVIGT